MTFNDFWNKYKKSLANKEKIEIALDAWSAGINSIRVEKLVSPKTADWTKEKPTTSCVFMTRVWDDHLKIYDYNIWRLITTNGESLESPTYLGWYTEDGDEWDDYSDCNFDEYKIIEEI